MNEKTIKERLKERKEGIINEKKRKSWQEKQKKVEKN